MKAFGVDITIIGEKAHTGKEQPCATNSGRMTQPVRRVNVDFASPMLLDRAALELNISRQAVIKTFIRQALDQRYLARNARAGSRRAR